MDRPVKLWFDGGCRPNPGELETMVSVQGRTHYRAGRGHGDNNDAEWLALLDALAVARDMGAREVVLIGDSAMVIAQARGDAPCRAPRFAAFLAQFRAAAGDFDSVRLRLIGRSHNLAGIALERVHGRL